MTDVTPSPATLTQRTPRWLLGVLFASLALNVFVVGSLGAAMWRFHRAPPPPEWAPPNCLLGFTNTLPRERHKTLRTAVAPIREQLRPLRNDVRTARNELTATISAEPFDLANFEAAQANLAEKERKARETMSALYAEIIKSLSPEERRAYSAWRSHNRPPPPPIGILEEGDGPPGGRRR